MAENLVLAQVLAGISALKTKAGVDAVMNAVKEHRNELKKNRSVNVPRFLTDEEKSALAKGNSEAMIHKNKEVFDYSRVAEKDLKAAKQWFKAPKSFSGKGESELVAA